MLVRVDVGQVVGLGRQHDLARPVHERIVETNDVTQTEAERVVRVGGFSSVRMTCWHPYTLKQLILKTYGITGLELVAPGEVAPAFPGLRNGFLEPKNVGWGGVTLQSVLSVSPLPGYAAVGDTKFYLVVSKLYE